MPCPTRYPLARRFRSPSGGSLRASKPWAVEQSVEEAVPAPLALPALQRGIPSFPPAVCWEVLPAQSSAGSPVGKRAVPSPGARPCSPQVR